MHSSLCVILFNQTYITEKLLAKHINTHPLVQSAGAVEYTDWFSVERQDSPTSVLDMTLNNLMVRFQ